MKTALTLAALLFAFSLSSHAPARAQGSAPAPSTWRKAKPIPPPVKAYKDLRGIFFAHTPEELGFEKTAAAPKVYGVMMEIGGPGMLGAVVSLRTGDASVYTGQGGMVIGGRAHEKVRAAAAAFCDEAEKHLAGMKPTKTYPYATLGRVKFYFLTFDGVFTTEAGLNELWEKHRLSPLFHAGNEVGQQLATLSQQKERDREEV